MDPISYMIFVGVVILMMGFTLWILVKFAKELPKKRVHHMKLLGEALDLPVREGRALYPKGSVFGMLKSPREIEGNYNGKAIKVFHIRQGYGNNMRIYSAIQVLGGNPMEMSFSIIKNSWVQIIINLFRRTQVVFGDKIFDAKFVVKTNHPEIMKIVLSDTLRVRLLELLKGFRFPGEIQLKGEKLVYVEMGMIGTEKRRKRFEQLVDIMCCLREEIDLYFKGN